MDKWISPFFSLIQPYLPPIVNLFIPKSKDLSPIFKPQNALSWLRGTFLSLKTPDLPFLSFKTVDFFFLAAKLKLSNKVIIKLSIIMKRTYQPKKGKRVKRHGFLKRISTKTGAAVIKKRRQKGRKKLSV